jgi:hypothetical protein
VRPISLDKERKPARTMTSPAAYLACPECGCTSFDEKKSQIATVEFTLVTVDNNGKQSLRILKESDTSEDDDTLYFCRSYCGFESYDIENDATLSTEYVEA